MGNAETLLIMMQQHNVKEENVLYPMCDQHLADQLENLLPELRAQRSMNTLRHRRGKADGCRHSRASMRVALSHPSPWSGQWRRSTNSATGEAPGTAAARALPAVQGARDQRFQLADRVSAGWHGGSPHPTSAAVMQALLSFDQAPPFPAPFRFFLTAPLFAMLAGLLMLWRGPDLFASRWTPSALAATHLITVGFMLQVMLGR
jgi:hypothetical protein